MEGAVVAAKKISRVDFGYMQNPELVRCGQTVLAYKYMLDCAKRRAPVTPGLKKLAKALDLDLAEEIKKTVNELMAEVRRKRREHWEAKKVAPKSRGAWLEGKAMLRAEAAGEKDWAKRVKSMSEALVSSQSNRKLTVITKGSMKTLEKIEVPNHDWFYSYSVDVLFHYDSGNFEAHSSDGDGKFFAHHSLRVTPKDMIK